MYVCMPTAHEAAERALKKAENSPSSTEGTYQ